MLLDSATATTRLFLALLVCGLSEACASTAAAPSTRDQKSDLVFTSRQRQANRGWIGILVGTAETGSGVRVLSVVPDSPAAAAGIVAGDDLMRVCGHSFAGPEDFIREVRASNPGTVLTIAGLRAGAERAFQVSVEAMPDENAVLERIFVGRPAPSLDGLVAIGSSAEPRWEQLRGRVVVLDFWAPWCGVCHLVASDLNQWQAEYSERL
jgi:thiol-disulfide isomerase/thioredoxin